MLLHFNFTTTTITTTTGITFNCTIIHAASNLYFGVNDKKINYAFLLNYYMWAS